MKWMVRLFGGIADGRYPRLVDLPTGAGKTDVVVIWALALSWYGLDASVRRPVPRRLIWVVNRRVLVQQVFNLADTLQRVLSPENADTGSLADVREGLRRLSGDETDILRIVQLRGQLIDDREWSVAPTVAQLIIGTVDQIGSRLLFQGYGLGKWSRPMQAGLLGIDAWLCVDEAHLVLAFVLTLRQVLRLITSEGPTAPESLSSFFERLPFWLTELSATPALPPPSADPVFRLLSNDENDPRLEDRLLAARTRRVMVQWVPKETKPEESIAAAAATFGDKAVAVAVFVRLPGAAAKISKKLAKQFPGRVLTITGRLRGYERDRLENHVVFKRFRSPHESSATAEETATVFLVGTAAAEVGLDADAAAIVCDFASLTTLIQRLGRLDRRGHLSRRADAGGCEPPTMTVFATPEVSNRDIERRILTLARSLRSERAGLSAPLLLGTHWKAATAKTDEQPDGAASDEKGEKAKLEHGHLLDAATRAILIGRSSSAADSTDTIARSPLTWPRRPIARVTGGPIAVPPLTAAVVEHWSATTNPQSAFLPVHPYLYGILPDEEGTPLVGVAFRLEMDAVAAVASEEDDEENERQSTAKRIIAIFTQFAPRRAELHFVPISHASDWFSTAEWPVAYFDNEDWVVSSNPGDRPFLQPGSILVLPTLAYASGLVEDANDFASRDVLDGVSTQRPSYLRRIIQVDSGDYELKSRDGAARFVLVEETNPPESALGSAAATPGLNIEEWKCHTSIAFRIGASTFRFEYFKPRRQAPSRLLLDDHLDRAREEAERISTALAPDNLFLRSLLVECARVHDIGKHNAKWQRAMGNQDLNKPVAKPLVDKPSSTGGFRHEWQSLLEMFQMSPAIPRSLSEEDSKHWVDLWCHLVASHHGHLRPWLSERVLDVHALGKRQQSNLRLESAERFSGLQRVVGPWRLAYLEALLKAADVAASKTAELEEGDEQ